ncbi:hypothetical protein CONPUDRAFT_169858 [Coniophora puteana RWD-64-598 SS2]|uniref:DUF6534 domain-containing protein n=1 Tax=Coniophora puteana (strain RWD-64-598) TaxID=741705 RepID=A0A5M3M7G5_CONPW|nr:uncharacterized protein CONPUDRAFT_169858 [Coniophora puteana RWD-64-598 SS2]EIW74997.1 hypothetical protein CONPUDRAFT_169858 [Coniophora puteana RWD-64-598 SS2]
MGRYDDTLGLLLIAAFFNTFLYGVVTNQYCLYFNNFNDRRIMKAMVSFMFLLDTAHSAALIYMSWSYTITYFGDPTELAIDEWPYALTPVLTECTALVTQLFLAWRIWRLSSNRILVGIACTLAFSAFVLGMTSGIKSAILKLHSKMTSMGGIIASWMVMQVVTDFFITTTLIITLVRSKSEFEKTRHNAGMFNQLIRGAIQTGLFASAFAVSALISFILWPGSTLYGLFTLPVGRIYSVTLLNTLISRADLQTPQRRVHHTVMPAQGGDSGDSTEPLHFTTVITVPAFEDSQMSGQAASEVHTAPDAFEMHLLDVGARSDTRTDARADADVEADVDGIVGDNNQSL